MIKLLVSFVFQLLIRGAIQLSCCYFQLDDHKVIKNHVGKHKLFSTSLDCVFEWLIMERYLTLEKVQLIGSGDFNAESSSQNYQKQNNKEEATGKNCKCPWTRAWAVGS